jgi:hypothetical protein
MDSDKYFMQLPRQFMARVIYGWILIMLVYFYLHNSLVHQWHQPPLILPEADNVYWMLHILHIPEFIYGSNLTARLFDGIMISTTLLFFFFPNRIIFCVVSLLCFWLFQIMFGTTAGHHYAHVGYLIVPLPFLFRNNERFTLTWQLIRYWILFLFVCAGLYKFYYEGFFHTVNMSSLMRTYFDEQSLRGQILIYISAHPAFAQIFYQLAAILETICIVGFFTRRWDIWLALGLLLFNLGNLFIMGIPFWENSFVIAVLLPWNNIYQYFERSTKASSLLRFNA